MKNRKLKWVLLLIFLLSISLPYVIANFFHPEEFVFGGYLQNPLDGNSYLAKMRQGYDGEWLFFLPFTSEKGAATLLFTFYLFLGHVARFSGLSLLIVFHVARIGCSILLFFCVEKFLQLYLPDDENIFNGMFAICVFGSGLGSIAYIATGEMTADFWVAEAYPFLSAYSNPHFPLGISLLLFILIQFHKGAKGTGFLWLGICSILLAIILPFAFVIGLMVIGTKEMIGVIHSRNLKSISPVLFFNLVGLPILIYQQWTATHDPLLIVWNEQNITASPPLWDILVSLSPILLFSVAGIFHTIKNKGEFELPTIWVMVSIVFLIIPISLQRRFLLGIFIPLSVLAGRGLFHAVLKQRLRKLCIMVVLFFSLLTNLVILTAGFSAGVLRNPKIYFSNDERQALNWLNENASWDDVVLASPELSMFIPGWAGARVVYGHPFETIDAVGKEALVNDFYKSSKQTMAGQAFIQSQQVKFIVNGPREKELSGSRPSDGFPGCSKEYSNETVEIFQCQ
jgi:hypothetical protein